MNPLLILLVGMLVVVVAVLRWRLHAFLALLAGASCVAFLTSSEGMYSREISQAGFQVVQSGNDNTLTLHRTRPVALPARYAWLRRDAESQDLQTLGEVVLRSASPLGDASAGDSIRVAVSSLPSDTAAPAVGDWLIDPRDLADAKSLAQQVWSSRIADGFGSTCAKIGLVIAMAAIIGRCLLDSGAAEIIVAAVRRGLGERHTPLAFALSGFVIGVPVYFDTVFYLLLPLARAMARRTGRDYLLYTLSIIIGATMAHSLVPPTPGPLLVAAELNVSLGMMILAGTAVGLVAVSSGFLYARWANRRWPLPLRDETNESAVPTASEPAAAFGPPLWLACLPIALPVALLSIGTLLQIEWETAAVAPPWLHALRDAWRVLGDKHIALGIATIVSLLMLIRYRPMNVDALHSVQDAILSAGNIVLITAAGGAFGHVLRQSGIATAIQERFPAAEGHLTLLLAAFFITSVIRIAQGSATVAMITSVGIVAPLVQTMTLPYHPVYVALAIGCGSKPIPWMNDSGFWVVTRMSGMSEGESLRTVSVVLTLMGFVGLAATLLGATWLPLL